jgi:hypothetical protein
VSGQVFGAPCSSRYEHLILNSGSYSTVANTDSNSFSYDSLWYGTPARPTHAVDATAYGTQPTQQSWSTRLNGNGPLNPIAPSAV